MRIRPISEKKQKLLDAKNSSELKVGERISVFEKAVSSYKKDSDKTCTCTISSLIDGITVFVGYEKDKDKHTTFYKITPDDISGRDLYDIGENPFERNVGDIRPIAFSFDSIIFQLDILGNKREGREAYYVENIKIEEANWNPFIYDKEGKKQYYQRPLVWNVEDKQLLIESVYQNIDCGKILVRKRGWDELRDMQKKGETELSWHDVVDGKQRLNAIKDFLLGEFPDLHGNYFSDLSFSAQHKFTNHQLFSYAEMPEGTRDEDVIRQFLKLNFAGVPQSLEHIDFVKSLQNKF